MLQEKLSLCVILVSIRVHQKCSENCSHNRAAENYQNTNACQVYQKKRTYDLQEVADMLQISKSRAYALCKQTQFKTVKIGKYVRISKTSFDNWFDSAE